MRATYKILTVLFILFTSHSFAQAYVKYEEEPPMILQQKSDYIKGFKLKYNIPASGYLYITLLKDGVAIGNSSEKITRGKRVIETNLMIWDGGASLTRKGEYAYRLVICESEKRGDFSRKVAEAPLIEGIKVVKKL